MESCSTVSISENCLRLSNGAGVHARIPEKTLYKSVMMKSKFQQMPHDAGGHKLESDPALRRSYMCAPGSRGVLDSNNLSRAPDAGCYSL